MLQPVITRLNGIVEDVGECRNLSNEIKTIQGTLGSAKLHAHIKMLSAHESNVITADGGTIPIEGQYDEDVNGFVKILIPGIAEIMVSPQDVDITGLEEQIAEKQRKVSDILKRYKSTDLKELYAKEEGYQKCRIKSDEIDRGISTHLNGTKFEELVREYQGIEQNPAIDVGEDLEKRIHDVLSNKEEKTIRERLVVIQSMLKKYEIEQISTSVLAENISQKENELENLNAKLDKLSSVVLSQKEFDKKREEITLLLNGRNGNSGLESEIEELIKEQGRNAENIEGIDLDILKQEVKNLQEIFEQKKHLYQQYSKIKEDFERLKSQQGDKFDIFYELFNKYLFAVTKGQVEMDDGELKSNCNILGSKELLSRGTRQTVLLAFRLALLKYYYQDEEGVLVLDDILLDMDPERRERSVKLLQEFAESNQIIFTTCDPAIADMLGGNRISI